MNLIALPVNSANFSAGRNRQNYYWREDVVRSRIIFFFVLAIFLGPDAHSLDREDPFATHEKALVDAIIAGDDEKVSAILTTPYILINRPVTYACSLGQPCGGYTYLGLATRVCDHWITKLLLNAGADPRLANKWGGSAMAMAVTRAANSGQPESGCSFTVKYLIGAGVGPNESMAIDSGFSMKPLQYVAWKGCRMGLAMGSIGMVWTLRESGGDVNIPLGQLPFASAFTPEDSALHMFAAQFTRNCDELAEAFVAKTAVIPVAPDFDKLNGRGARPIDLAATRCKRQPKPDYTYPTDQMMKKVVEIWRSSGSPDPSPNMKFCAWP
ncbi:ankyrin repeat domain-containing protein [Rhizobium ruizarguesonis]|uniref:ankyrin repeat domain-containing protein n=1 Tax=Rhizobium TaxID=379 RepID=UPI001031B4C9|nr:MULTISPECIES: ankyrin repeat domain-containing protein [Rhizobium]NKL79029.1 hypothetical protein [Rhizobium leguminosarum bv. viciae]TBA68958.1 ankyrin repeat domain-containing protein [Rhizobium ruizarguesonis]